MKIRILLIIVAGLAINTLFIALQIYEENQTEMTPYIMSFAAEQKQSGTLKRYLLGSLTL